MLARGYWDLDRGVFPSLISTSPGQCNRATDVIAVDLEVDYALRVGRRRANDYRIGGRCRRSNVVSEPLPRGNPADVVGAANILCSLDINIVITIYVTTIATS